MPSALAAATVGFEDVDFDAPLRVEDYIEKAPAGGVIKGMFFNCIRTLAQERSGKTLGRERYSPFTNYPIKEWLTLLPACAQAAHPQLPLRRALFETGGHTYRTFANSTLGRVIMSVAGSDFRSAMRLVSRAYNSLDPTIQVALVLEEERRAVVRMRNMLEYPDCYQAGVLAAGARSYGMTPRIRVLLDGPFDCDIELSW